MMKKFVCNIKTPDECPYRYIDYYPFDVGTGRCRKLHGKECDSKTFPDYCVLEDAK